MPSVYSVNQPLLQRRRLMVRSLSGPRLGAGELAILVGCGFAAAVMSAVADFSFRIPGHAILRAAVPLSLGMALVPRRGAGLTMGSAAFVGVMGLSLAGVRGMGFGATTSLMLFGPSLDFAVRRARDGWRLYAAFALAGLVANLGAFLVRGGTKLSGGAGAGLRALQDWLSIAPLSYAACGLVAGLIGAAICFRAGGTIGDPESDEPAP